MTRRLVLGVIALTLAVTPLDAQAPSASQWLLDINRDIWRPFLDGVAANDHHRYLGVRSRDYIRLQADARFFLDYDDYVDDTKAMMARYAARGATVRLDVRFTERITNGVFASERGVMRVVIDAEGRPGTPSYSYFQTTSRKEDGTWKVLVDYFGADRPAPDAAAFERAHPLTDVEPFGCYMTYPDKTSHCGR
jgi:hypothetical protein